MSNFSTREFERSHGKAPRGRGFWGFRLTTWGVTDVSAVLEADFWFNGTFASARKAAKAEAIRTDASHIEVLS
jgi:hypothetical protein